MSATSVESAVARLDEITRRLRRECPWDREQDERSIVPHTVEEAYELADAAHAQDDAKLLDELGDVLFQVCFLALLLEERGAGDLAAVAEHCTAKLVRRHPHVFGDARAATAAQVLRNWDAIKREEAGEEGGVFGDVPGNLPALLLARKLQRRAASAGLGEADREEAVAGLREAADALATAPEDRQARLEAVGRALFATVAAARTLGADPELALREEARRFRAEAEARAAARP